MQKKHSALARAPYLGILVFLLAFCGVLLWSPAISGAASASDAGQGQPGGNRLAARNEQHKERGQASGTARKPSGKQLSKQDPAPLTVATRSLIHKDGSCSVMVNYPQVGNEKIDAELDFWANKTVRTFVSGIENFASGEVNRYSMLVDYELTETSGRFISIVFRISTETGGTHPDSGMVTFTYDLSDGRKLEMHDIFGDAPGLLQFLSIYSYERLLGELGQEFEGSIKHGTSPNILNFSLFSLRPDGLVIYFPPYQVAGYKHGEQQVSINFNRLKAYKPRADLWRGNSEYGAISGNTLLRPPTLGGEPEKTPY